MLKKYISLWLLVGLFCATISAQKADYYHQIITFDGKEYEGDIINFQPGDVLHLRLANGEEIFLAADAVKRIIYIAPTKQKTSNRNSLPQTAVSAGRPSGPKRSKQEDGSQTLIKEKDWIVRVGSGFSFSSTSFDRFGFRDNTFGYIVSLSVVRQLHPNLQLGAGLDYTSFDPGNQENAFSLFGSVRGFSSIRQRAFFLQVDGGYSLPTTASSDLLIEKDGGFLLHPSIGYVFRLTDKLPELSIDFGYRFTDQSRTFNNFGSIRTQNNSYRRATIRCNVAF